jgi:hypothetical protein
MSQKTSIFTRSAAHLAQAKEHPTHALAYAFMSAFGVNLSDAEGIAHKIIDGENWPVLALVMAASVQVRDNVVFVGDDFKGVNEEFPEFIIPGRSGVKDSFNFSAMHLVGHVICNLAHSSKLAEKALKKGGDCVTGKYCGESVAGIINRTISNNWSFDEKQAFANRAQGFNDDALANRIEALQGMAREFYAHINA